MELRNLYKRFLFFTLSDDLNSFQTGVDSIYDAIVAKGKTPSSKSLSDIITAINNLEIGTDIKHNCYVSAPFDYSNDNNGLEIYVDGSCVYRTYGHWCARSWSGVI